MRGQSRRQLRNIAGALALTGAILTLSACAIWPGTSRQPPSAPTPVMLPGAPQPPAAVRAAEAAVRGALARHGYRLVDDAAIQADVSLARRNNDVGYQEPAGGAVAAPGDDRIDLCRDQTYRLTVLLTDRRTGTIVHRGAAERRRCGELGAGDLRDMAAAALRSDR